VGGRASEQRRGGWGAWVDDGYSDKMQANNRGRKYMRRWLRKEHFPHSLQAEKSNENIAPMVPTRFFCFENTNDGHE
jgi:hypothetical protein